MDHVIDTLLPLPTHEEELAMSKLKPAGCLCLLGPLTMKVHLIAFDSLGVRSMATLVETSDTAIFIDPSAALGPRRYGLPPHPLELQRLEESLNEITSAIENADIVIITHYHYDHHNPTMPEILKGKEVYVKHPTDHINVSQRIRASKFLKALRSLPCKVEYADERSVRVGSTEIHISPPVPHGINDRLGYVVMVSIKDGDETVLFTSDVEGPPLAEQATWIIDENPDILILDGPMTYMLGYRYPVRAWESSLTNLRAIVNNTSVRCIVIDHHFMRDLNHTKWAYEIERMMPRRIEILSAAEYMGRKPLLLEALRKELYDKYPEGYPPNFML